MEKPPLCPRWIDFVPNVIFEVLNGCTGVGSYHQGPVRASMSNKDLERAIDASTRVVRINKVALVMIRPSRYNL